ncbi:unnamed protein product, partial [Bubo scandiacus]
ELPVPLPPPRPPIPNPPPQAWGSQHSESFFWFGGFPPPLFFFPGGGLKYSSAVVIGHWARTWQALAKQRRSSPRLVVVPRKKFENYFSAKLHFLRNLMAVVSAEETLGSFWQ